MKLHQPGLFSAMEPPMVDPTHVQAVQIIKIMTKTVHGRATKCAALSVQASAQASAQASDERLAAGALSPYWAFAMSYAALLLVMHGDGVLDDAAGWCAKVADLRGMLGKVSKRWKIAGKAAPLSLVFFF
jgi:hypothetical protein